MCVFMFIPSQVEPLYFSYSLPIFFMDLRFLFSVHCSMFIEVHRWSHLVWVWHSWPSWKTLSIVSWSVCQFLWFSKCVCIDFQTSQSPYFSVFSVQLSSEKFECNRLAFSGKTRKSIGLYHIPSGFWAQRLKMHRHTTFDKDIQPYLPGAQDAFHFHRHCHSIYISIDARMPTTNAKQKLRDKRNERNGLNERETKFRSGEKKTFTITKCVSAYGLRPNQIEALKSKRDTIDGNGAVFMRRS